MTHRVVLSPEAAADLDGIREYITAQAGRRIAAGYVEALLAACFALERFPERGTRRSDIHPELRTFGVRRSATIAFRVRGDTVTILRVLYGGRDLASAFAEG